MRNTAKNELENLSEESIALASEAKEILFLLSPVLLNDLREFCQPLLDKEIREEEWVEEKWDTFKDFWLAIPWVIFRFLIKKDKDGKLERWLIEHPEFFDETLLSWPEWLLTSSDSTSDRSIH